MRALRLIAIVTLWMGAALTYGCGEFDSDLPGNSQSSSVLGNSSSNTSLHGGQSETSIDTASGTDVGNGIAPAPLANFIAIPTRRDEHRYTLMAPLTRGAQVTELSVLAVIDGIEEQHLTIPCEGASCKGEFDANEFIDTRQEHQIRFVQLQAGAFVYRANRTSLHYVVQTERGEVTTDFMVLQLHLVPVAGIYSDPIRPLMDTQD